MTQSRYVFDLDNTLFYTDSLNNESYNHALETLGFPSILGHKRVTREMISEQYQDIENEQTNQLIELKQLFFLNNLNRITINTYLFELLQQQNPEVCILWTSADVNRVIGTLKHFQIEKSFKETLFSDKKEIGKDVEKIIKIFECNSEDLIFYEDDLSVINELEKLGLNAFAVKQLDD